MLQGGLLQVPAQLQELGLTLLVELYLRGCDAARLLQPLADLLQLPGEVRALLLCFGAGGPLCLDLLLQLLDAGLAVGKSSVLAFLCHNCASLGQTDGNVNLLAAL